jgi:predicted dehydrogenase
MRKMKMGILAAGGIARIMAQTVREMNSVELYAVAARDKQRAEEFSKEFEFKKAYGSYQELAEDSNVDFIYIASPHSSHYEHIKLCLDHGKHVICEKAFTANTAQAEEVIKLAEEKNLLLTEAMWVRYMPMAKTLKEVIASGVIGEISTVIANLFYVIDGNERIYEPKLAGGALLDVGVYALTFASIVLGDEVETIQSSAIKFETGVDSQSSVIMTYKSGQMAVCTSGTGALSDRMGTIYGRKGYIIVENINNFESISVYDLNRKLIEKYDCPKQITGYEYEIEACMDAIEKGMKECPDMPHSQTITIMSLMDEIREQLNIKYPFE